MRFPAIGATLLIWTVSTGAVALAQTPAVTVDDDDITIRGCVTQPGPPAPGMARTLVWSRGDIMLAAAEMPSSLSAGNVFYWLDDEDELKEHVGQRVEIRGELDDFEKGEIEIDRDDDFTKIELELDGDSESVRVPTAWLAASAPEDDREIDIVARRVDVKDVRVIGACGRP